MSTDATGLQGGSERDTTEADRALREVREVRESLHDIRNHLNAILGLVSMMLLQSRDEAATRFGPLVEEQSEQLRYLIDRLGQPGQASAVASSGLSLVDPSRLVPALADLYTPYAAENGMRLKFRVDAGTPRLTTDGRALHRLLSNLLVNAVKHSQASLVILRAAPADPAHPAAGVQFIVVDDGVGVDPVAMPSLQRVLEGRDAPESDHDRCGLRIVARLAHELGGGVTLDSEPDDGTTVTLVVPSHEPQPLMRAA